MRKKIITKKIKEVEIITDIYICDWCDKEFDNKIIPYEVNNFQLTHDTGYNYPEGDFCEQKHVELCIECRLKFFKLLIENGIRINKIYREKYYDEVIK